MIVFDGHNDTLTRHQEGDPVKAFIQGNFTSHIDLPRAKAGGLAGGFFAIFTPPPEDSPERDPMYGVEFTEQGYTVTERSPIDQPYAEAYTDTIIEYAHQLEANANGQLKIVKDYPQMLRCIEIGTLAVVLHLEGAEAIHDDLSNLEKYYRQGIRSIGLVWSRPNRFGYGVPFRFPGSPDTGPGLTDAGKALVRACNELGILIDLAHLNEKGFWDAAECSTMPLVVTHADVHAICPSTRNLTDGQINAIGASNGVIGINFETLNTHPQSSIERDVPLTQITAHIDYIAERIGIDHVAFGSDFDGADMPLLLSDASKLPALIHTLFEQGYSEENVEKIAYKNWLRVLKTTWK